MIRSAAVRVGLGVGCQGRNGPRGGESGDLGWRVGPGPARGERSRVPEAVGVQNFRNSVSGSGHSGLDPRTGPIGLKAVIEIIYSDFLF